MPKLHVNKSILINAPVEKVFNTLHDFHHWNAWSPWLIIEPGCKLNVSEDGKFYEWEGSLVGSGNMKITGEKANEQIESDLNFLKPWKSYARVKFLIKSEGSGTRINWLMDSSIPFFMFFMKKMMTELIGMDFKRGLSMLKDYIEDGKVHSQMEFKGVNEFAGCKYIGIKSACSMEQLSDKMKVDFGKIGELVSKHHDLVTPPMFSMYHKWDIAKQSAVYTAGIAVKEIPAQLPAGMISGEIPATKLFTVKHTGPYLHLGNPWNALYSRQRAKVFKLNKKVDPFEVYVNTPMDTPEKELITEVNFPILS